MHACMYVYAYVHNNYMHVFVYVASYVYMRVCNYVCIYRIWQNIQEENFVFSYSGKWLFAGIF